MMLFQQPLDQLVAGDGDAVLVQDLAVDRVVDPGW